MKLVTLLLALASVSSGQTATPSVAGSWTAQFEGTTFVRLELRMTDGGISGGIGLGHFEVDNRGAVRRADKVPPSLTPISDVIEHGSSLVFTLKEGDEPDRFEFRLVDGRHAELLLLLDDEDREELASSGIGAPRPILLTRQ